MNLCLLNYNNYYNRQVKKFDNLEDYSSHILHITQDINFNPADGIDTTHIVNYSGETQPDYVLITDGNEIVSRWFVLDCDFIRKGQYQLILHRDLIADNYDDVISAPVFVEKATLDNDDPGIYNSENMSFNEIKTSETPLKDKTGTPWIVGYVPADSFKEDTQIDTQFIDPGHPDIEVDDITQWEYYKYATLNETPTRFVKVEDVDVAYEESLDYHFVGSTGGMGGDPVRINTTGLMYIDCHKNGDLFYVKRGTTDIVYTQNGRSLGISTSRSASGLKLVCDDMPQNLLPNAGSVSDFFCNRYLVDVQNRLRSGLTDLVDKVNEDLTNKGTDNGSSFPALSLQGQRILDKATGIVYAIKIKEENYQIKKAKRGDFPTASDYAYYAFPKDLEYSSLSELVGRGHIYNENTGMNRYLNITGKKYSIELSQITTRIQATVTNADNRYHLYDAPYDMFCMPYNDDYVLQNGTESISNRKYAALAMAIAIGAKTGAGNVYDVQLLPYCPVRNAINENGTINLKACNYDYITAGDGGTKYGAIIWCDKSDFTFDIDYEVTIEDYKESNECDKYRLCSPNYASAFEFSAAKNKGVSKFNIDCTYKPFSPYIHVNPDFKGLYGQDFNDARGLILGGDFSITQLNSAWANYELTNKNFQQSFDRQIQNMEVNNKYQKISEGISAGVGAVQGAVSGGIMGSLLGPAGTAIGALAGGALSAGAGAADIAINDKLRAEALDYTKDQFGYQLGNIQAVPYAISKTTAMTSNNKLFPFVEYYTCTDIEKQALKNKLLYNGMTVMRIGTIAEFKKATPSYIKCKLIRLENTDNDFHTVNAISAEIDKGFFI